MERTLDSPDTQLLTAWFAQGDRSALEALVARHLARIRRVIFAMVPHDATADDLTQDVFERALRRLGTFSARAEFATWLYRIALHTVYDHLERVDRERLEFTVGPIRDPPSPAADPSDQLVSVEQVRTIEQALLALPPKRRAALILTCLEGKTVDEVAAIEGCPPQTIYSRVHEARRQLKRDLKHLLP